VTDSLDFEKAEYGTPAQSSCTECQNSLGTQYYECNGRTICGGCKAALESARDAGSRAGRALRAIGFGSLAAALGTAIWYGVRALTGYEFGLLAILVGLAVGGAVRAGSRARGGWAYQALAMFLTYASIVSTYVPDILKGLSSPEAQTTASTAQPATAATPAPASAAPATTLAVSATQTAEPAEPPPSFGAALGMLVLAGLFLMGIAFVAPFLGGLENIMGLIIIGIGLYEAWKINRRSPLVITGPYRLAATSAPPRD